MADYKVGDSVKRAELKPFEVDLLVTSLKTATGEIRQIHSEQHKNYEVLWTWPDGKTCVAHYSEDQIELAE